MKKMTALLLIVLFAAVLMPISAGAAGSDNGLPYVTDEAGLLTDSQRLALENRAAAMSEKHRCEVRIVTVDDMSEYGFRVIDEFSYQLYKEYDFGYGPDKDCVLFVLSMYGRDYDLRVWGSYAETAFTLYGIDNVLDSHVLPQLKNNNYNRAFTVFLDRAEEYFRMAEEGKPFDARTDPDAQRMASAVKLAITILLPLLIASIICAIWKSKMKTAKIATTAFNYIPPGGFRLTGQGDVFLYRTTTRRKIEKSSSSGGRASGGGIGGSSGRSGKF